MSNSRNNRRPKKVEVNVDRDDINKADEKMTKDRKPRGKRCDVKGKDNDPSWYSHFPQLLKDTASFAFSYPTGTQVIWDDVSEGALEVSNYNKSVAGIAVLNYFPTIGKAGGSSADPINVAANSNYTFIRRNVSTYANYDATDYMQYLLAMDSAFSVYAKLVRIYGLMQASNVFNRYYPRAIVNALGFSYDSLITNLADFRAQINAYAYKLAQFCVPADMDFFKRHIWMEQNVFTDAASSKSQSYVYNSIGFYYFAEQTEGPAKLVFKRYKDYTDTSTQKIKYEEIPNILNDAILPLMESQDCIAMSGDTLRAYGSDRIYAMAPIAENYITLPVYSEEVLSQFENATLVGEPVTVSAANISPDIVQQVELDFGGVGLKQTLGFDLGANTSDQFIQRAITMQSSKMINAHKSEVTPEDVAVMTRLSTTVDKYVSNSTTEFYAILSSYGSEIGCNIQFFAFDTVGDKWQCIQKVQITSVVNAGPSYEYNSALNLVFVASMWSQFDWCPAIYYSIANTANTAFYKAQLMDVDNWTMLTHKDLKVLNETVMLSLFDSPLINSMSTKPI